MYKIYIDGVLFPVAPEKIETQIHGKNETLTLINEGEINLIKKAGLTTISFDIMLPYGKYPFADYENGYKSPDYYLKAIKELKLSEEPFRLIINRILEKGEELFGTNLKVTLEDYSIIEDANNGFDMVVSLNFKQYIPYGLNTFKIKKNKVKKKKKRGEGKKLKKIFRRGEKVIVNGRITRSRKGGMLKTLHNTTCTIHLIRKTKKQTLFHVKSLDGKWIGWTTAKSIKKIVKKRRGRR